MGHAVLSCAAEHICYIILFEQSFCKQLQVNALCITENMNTLQATFFNLQGSTTICMNIFPTVVHWVKGQQQQMLLSVRTTLGVSAILV